MSDKFQNYLIIGTLSIVSVSCTLKEPDETKDVSGNLISISAMSVPFVGITYDNAGKVTQISDVISGTKITVDYQNNRLEWVEYDERYNHDETTVYISYRTVWSNFQTNSNGYIVSADAVEIDYESNGNIRHQEEYSVVLSYSANGNLIKYTIVDEEYGDEITTYEWKDGRLMNTEWEDGYIKYGYDDAPDNYYRVWIPWWGDPTPLAMTGLMGMAPIDLITSSTLNEEYGYTETNYFYYNMTDNGYIAQMKVGGYDFEGMVFNFNYSNTRTIEEFTSPIREGKKSYRGFFHKKKKHQL